ncbi:hypothetical protein Dda_0301 [Drechslerella dactyloides]|uniref:Uncharacterized protein n=1 Tax=Drechslerella dactyloides TaxID=74499 RepID=A0AAD6NMK1_DREDA|nr:hypothetical protein Dda_0301 [Drechslerella dactyloides]
MPSKWHRRFTSQRAKHRKLHKRSSSSDMSVSSSSASTMASGAMPSMGLFDEFGNIIGILVDCFLEVQIVGLRSCVSLRILLRNKSGGDAQFALFRAKTAEHATITSAECYVDVEGRESAGLEYRDVLDHVHYGSIFECEVGAVQANRDCVIFLRYEHDLTIEDDAAVLRFPLPGRKGEKLIARQKTQPGMWNASQMFSFIALDIQIADFPAKIASISSSHSVSASIVEESNASVDVDDFVFMGQDEVELRILSEPQEDGPLAPHPENDDAPSMDMDLYIKSIDSDARSYHSATSTKGGIPVINVVDETLEAAVESAIISQSGKLQISLSDVVTSLPTCAVEERRSPRPIQTSASQPNLRSTSSSPPNIEVERLYSDIWEVNEARMSYSSSSEESTCSTRLRRRKTTVHKKHNSYMSSSQTDLSETSWLDDPSDDEVNDEAERIFEEYSSVRIPSRATARDSFAILDDFDVEECKSIRIIRPHQPRIVHIPSPKMPHIISIENITPPSSPIRGPKDCRPVNSSSNELLTELTILLENLNELMEESPTPYFLLDEKFAETLGLQLRKLKVHPGAQSLNLPDTPSWVREGIWANAIVLQFLKCVMDSPFFKTLNNDLKSEYRLLYTLVELPFSSHVQHLSHVAALTRVSEEELLELAGEIIQEQLMDGEDQIPAPPAVGDRKVAGYSDAYVSRPISPPKTPDDNDRKKADTEAFVASFEASINF